MFEEPPTNPAHDVLYRIHQFQAQSRGQSALPYDQFSARLRGNSDTDLTGLLLPPTEVRLEILATREPKFSLGQLCITPQAATAVPPDEVLIAVARHAAGDWGTLDEHDRRENERALLDGGRLVSAYQSSSGQKFWVITECDRQITNVELHISRHVESSRMLSCGRFTRFPSALALGNFTFFETERDHLTTIPTRSEDRCRFAIEATGSIW